MASSFLSFFFFVLLDTITVAEFISPSTPPKFSAILVLGDSTMDTGNNNFIGTAFKGNHYPYGQNFPGRIPTGRFSDGKLVPDLLASALGIKELVPPFLDPFLADEELKTGVSFASAGSGLDDLTTAASGVIPVSRQLEYFKEYLKRLKRVAGEQEAQKILSSALVLISAGTNDFIFNFYDLPTRRVQFDIKGYQNFLLQKLQDLIKELVDLGCGKFMVAGVPPFGCVPIQITAKFKNIPTRTCVEEENKDASGYNLKLKGIVKELQESYKGSKLVYIEVYKPLMDMIEKPETYGFLETKKGCCGSGLVEVGPLCNFLTPSCANASEYLFWDSIHPCEVAYKLLTRYLLNQMHLLFFPNTTVSSSNV